MRPSRPSKRASSLSRQAPLCYYGSARTSKHRAALSIALANSTWRLFQCGQKEHQQNNPDAPCRGLWTVTSLVALRHSLIITSSKLLLPLKIVMTYTASPRRWSSIGPLYRSARVVVPRALLHQCSAHAYCMLALKCPEKALLRDIGLSKPCGNAFFSNCFKADSGVFWLTWIYQRTSECAD
jgi:hypothetical protein